MAELIIVFILQKYEIIPIIQRFLPFFISFPPHFPENYTPAPHADPQRISLIELAKMQFAKDSLLQGER